MKSNLVWLAVILVLAGVGAVVWRENLEPAIAKGDPAIWQDNNKLKLYVKEFGPAATIEALVSLKDTYGDCHQTAHRAGHYAYEFFGDQAFQTCRSECHSGCYHGAVEAYFAEHGTKNLEHDLPTICQDSLNGFFSHQCIHGVGHGLMAWTSNDLPRALESCNLLPNLQDSCWSGVFMENIVAADPNVPDKHETQFLTDDPHYPCTMVEEKYKNTCYFLQTSRVIQLFPGNFQKVAEFCAEAPEAHQRACYGSMGRDVGGTYRENPEAAINACYFILRPENRRECLGGAVQDFYWDPSGEKAAEKFCNLLRDSEEKAACEAIVTTRRHDLTATPN